MCMTPLGFVFEGNVLQNASVMKESTVTSMGQQTYEYDFTDDRTFNTEWE